MFLRSELFLPGSFDPGPKLPPFNALLERQEVESGGPEAELELPEAVNNAIVNGGLMCLCRTFLRSERRDQGLQFDAWGTSTSTISLWLLCETAGFETPRE